MLPEARQAKVKESNLIFKETIINFLKKKNKIIYCSKTHALKTNKPSNFNNNFN